MYPFTLIGDQCEKLSLSSNDLSSTNKMENFTIIIAPTPRKADQLPHEI